MRGLVFFAVLVFTVSLEAAADVAPSGASAQNPDESGSCGTFQADLVTEKDGAPLFGKYEAAVSTCVANAVRSSDGCCGALRKHLAAAQSLLVEARIAAVESNDKESNGFVGLAKLSHKCEIAAGKVSAEFGMAGAECGKQYTEAIKSCRSAQLTPAPSGEEELKQYEQTKAKMEEIAQQLLTSYDVAKKQIASAMSTSQANKGDCNNLWSQLMTAGKVTGVVGGTAMALKTYGDIQDKKERKEKAAEDRRQALVHMPDGGVLDCKSAVNYAKAECREPLMFACSNSQVEGSTLCQTFVKLVCSSADAAQSYCLSREAKAYCSSGTALAESPSCQWVSKLPAACLQGQGKMECFPNVTGASLKKACESYPHDPVCESYKNGSLLWRPGADGLAVAQNQERNTGSVNDLVATNPAMASLTSVSMWQSNSSALQNACASEMLDCQ